MPNERLRQARVRVMELCRQDLADLERYAERPQGVVRRVIVHRISAHQEDATFGDDAAEICRFFHEHPIGIAASGGKMPYPVLIDQAGQVTQLVPLGRITPHARAYNEDAVGIGCIGDFRQQPVAEAQWSSLVLVCSEVLAACDLLPAVLVGHDELPGASRDPDKICPGEHLSLPALREAVELALARPDRPTIGLAW